MKMQITSSQLKGEVKAITSKSFAHRCSICEYLATGKTELDGVLPSDDILATSRCLNALKTGEVLDAGESGSTLRFMIPIVAMLGGSYTFVGHGKLMSRPNDELFNVLNSHGVNARLENEKILVDGKLKSGEFKIRGDISSQYISGLLMALPLLDGDSVIIPTTSLASRPYIDITLEVLKNYNIEVVERDGAFFIKGNQKYISFNGEVEGDWSNSAFFLVGGAISKKVTVTGLNLDTTQGDKAILEVLKLAGAKVKIRDSKVTVKKSKIKPFNFDADSCPDLVPITAVLGACALGDTTIKNIGRLKIKESDRILSTITLLSTLGVKAEKVGENLIVHGNGGRFSGGTVSSFNDHRIVMSSAIAGLKCKEKLIIDGANAVNKSYPTFFTDYAKLGGKANEEI